MTKSRWTWILSGPSSAHTSVQAEKSFWSFRAEPDLRGQALGQGDDDVVEISEGIWEIDGIFALGVPEWIACRAEQGRGGHDHLLAGRRREPWDGNGIGGDQGRIVVVEVLDLRQGRRRAHGEDIGELFLEGRRPRGIVIVEILEPPDKGFLARESRLDVAGEVALAIESRARSRAASRPCRAGCVGVGKRPADVGGSGGAVEFVRLQWTRPKGQNGVAGSKNRSFSPTWTMAASESSWS